MTIDYDATIKKTLILIADFLNHRATKTRDIHERTDIINNSNAIREWAVDPRGRIAPPTWWPVSAGFIMRGSNDNTYYHAFNKLRYVVYLMYSDNHAYSKPAVQRDLLRCVKRWNYLQSDNLFKDFYYPFVPVERFAVAADSNVKSR